MAKSRTPGEPAALSIDDCPGSRINCERFFFRLPQTFHWCNEKRYSALEVGFMICYYSSINREQLLLLQSFYYKRKIILVSLMVVLGLAFFCELELRTFAFSLLAGLFCS